MGIRKHGISKVNDASLIKEQASLKNFISEKKVKKKRNHQSFSFGEEAFENRDR